MSSVKKVIARAVQDDPWLVSARPPKEMYVPNTIQCRKVVKHLIPVSAQVTAKEAREHGVELGAEIADEEMVEVEVPEEVEEEKVWWETRLCFNGRLVRADEETESVVAIPQRGHRQKMREEIATAIEAPLNYVHYEKLIRIIQEEIDHWKSNNMYGQAQRPLVLVLLGTHEAQDDQDLEERTYSRSVYFIKSCSPTQLQLVNPRNEELEVQLGPGMLELCYQHNFILFAPSNLHFYDYYSDEEVA